MKGCFKTVDITPPAGTSMGGNCREDAVSRGMHDPLCADIIVLESRSGKIALIDLDWCESAPETISEIKKKIVLKTGLEYENICITMTHTHSSPDVYGCYNLYGLNGMSEDYIRETAGKLAYAVEEALSGMEDILAGVGKDIEDRLSFNRRVFFKDGSLHMNWEILENTAIRQDELDKPEGPVDTDLFVVKFCGLDGRLKAIMVNFTLHPAILVMEDMLFSKDFIWALERDLKEVYGSDVLVYFANGAEGNINHIDMWNREQKRSWPEAERVGSLLAAHVGKLLDKIEVREQDTLEVISERLAVPVRKISDTQVEKANALWKKCGGVIPGLTDGVPEEWYAWDIIKLSKDKRGTRELELQVIRIGDIVIAALPGEFFTEFGLALKESSPFRHTLVFGLANGSIGYVPTERAFRSGGYEPETCELSILVPEAGNMVVEKLLQIIAGLNRDQ